MRRFLPRRALVVLALVLSFIALAAPPAKAAYTYTGAQNIRNHAGVSVWTPRGIDFNSGWDFTNGRSWMVFGFDWSQSHHKLEVGQGIAIEINARVDCDWARSRYTWQRPDSFPSAISPGREGYDPRGFETNIPTSLNAFPYEDTTVLEPCDQYHKSGTGRGWFGIGVLNAQNLIPGQHYWVKVAMDNIQDQYSYRGYQSPVEIRTKVGVVYNAGTPLPMDDHDCSFDQTDTNAWNNQDYHSGWLRQQAAWCQYTDFEHEVIPLSAGWMTGTNYWPPTGVDKLLNQGLEENPALTQYNVWSSNGGSATRYCEPGAFDGSCFVQYNNGASGGSVSVYQDRPMVTAAGYSPTAEVAARCRNGSSCGISVAVWGLGITNAEGRSASASIPNDGHWYICKLDADHGSSGFAGPHNLLRWEVYNGAINGGNMDLDYTFLGGKTNWKDADDGQPLPIWGTIYIGVGRAYNGHPTHGPVCVQK